MHTIHIHLTPELIFALIGLLVTGIKYLAERHKLPAVVEKALAKIGMGRIETLIAEAQTFAEKTKGQRREYVVTKVIGICQQEGISIPESFIRMGLEYVFSRMKGAF